MAELSPAEKNAISHRGRAARLLAATSAAGPGARVIRTKSGAAALSIASNALADRDQARRRGDHRLDRDHHRGGPLADRPGRLGRSPSSRSARPTSRPTREHPYGHEKVESLAATIEGMLILVGAGIIVYEATHRLVVGSEVESLGVGIAVMGFSVVANLVVSAVLSRQARAHESPALEGDAAHLRTDALTSAGVLVGLRPGRRRPRR